jgi:hypothetical protein
MINNGLSVLKRFISLVLATGPERPRLSRLFFPMPDKRNTTNAIPLAARPSPNPPSERNNRPQEQDAETGEWSFLGLPDDCCYA